MLQILYIARDLRANIMFREPLGDLRLRHHALHEVRPERFPSAGAISFLVDVEFSTAIAEQPR